MHVSLEELEEWGAANKLALLNVHNGSEGMLDVQKSLHYRAENVHFYTSLVCVQFRRIGHIAVEEVMDTQPLRRIQGRFW